MNEALVRTLILPLHERLRGRNTVAAYRALRDGERLDPASLRRLREVKLRALLAHCRDHVPYYRERFADGAVGDLTLEGLAALPPLERDDIRAHCDRMIADNYRGRVLRYSTGGSTGHPLVFYTDLDKEAWHNAHKLRCRAWHGILPGARQADLWGSPIELDKQSRLRIWKDRHLLNQVLLSAFDLGEARLQRYLCFLARFRPRLLYGYPTVIYRLARHTREHPGLTGSWRPQLVSCTSEMLLDHQRATIAEVFGCPVVNEYGSRDGGLIAHECTAGNLHIAAEHVIVEVDAPDDRGIGDLLVTNLDARGMPLIRYRLGDRGSLRHGDCPCGLPLPMMGEVAGRANDFLVGAGGKPVHSLAPIYVLRDMEQIRQFKLTQRPDLSLLIEIVPAGDGLSDSEARLIRERMVKILGIDVPVQIEIREVIAPEQSGKYRWVVCQAECGRG